MQIGSLLRLGAKKLTTVSDTVSDMLLSDGVRHRCNKMVSDTAVGMATIGTMVSDTARLDAELLLSHVLGCSRSKLLIDSEKAISEPQKTKFLELIDRRSKGEPIAYLIGQREFWSLSLDITPDVLIPRPETELLVELALEKEVTKIADLGTGSGAIALAIAHERPHWQIIATDISEKALTVAKNNAKQLEISNIEFRLGDWTQALHHEKFDLIVSNPPYIPENDSHLKQGDLLFEPQKALVSGRDGLQDLKKIIEQARNYLSSEGWLMVEHGYDQSEVVRDIFKQYGYKNVHQHMDLSGIIRVTTGQI